MSTEETLAKAESTVSDIWEYMCEVLGYNWEDFILEEQMHKEHAKFLDPRFMSANIEPVGCVTLSWQGKPDQEDLDEAVEVRLTLDFFTGLHYSVLKWADSEGPVIQELTDMFPWPPGVISAISAIMYKQGQPRAHTLTYALV